MGSGDDLELDDCDREDDDPTEETQQPPEMCPCARSKRWRAFPSVYIPVAISTESPIALPPETTGSVPRSTSLISSRIQFKHVSALALRSSALPS
jgi:hypothetical protein